MTVKEIETSAKQRMEKVLADLQHAMSSVRTGRASINMLDGIRIDYYGTPTPLSQVATLLVPEPGLLTAQPWDVSQIGAIEKAIRTSDLGLNPQNDGKIIRIPIPPLTEERRKDLVKQVKKMAEEHKIGVRDARRGAMEMVKELEDDGTISTDDKRRVEKQVQDLTDDHVKKIDEMIAHKEKEVLEV